MNPLIISALIILCLIVVQVMLYKTLRYVKNSRRIILWSFVMLYPVVLPILLVPAPAPPGDDHYQCGLVMVAVYGNRVVIALSGIAFTLAAHMGYRAVANTKQFSHEAG